MLPELEIEDKLNPRNALAEEERIQRGNYKVHQLYQLVSFCE